MDQTRRQSSKKRKLRPLNEMVLIRQDKDKEKTSGGIILPDSAKIPTLTGIVVAVPENVNEFECPIRELDTVIYDTRYQVPVDLEPGNQFYLIPFQYIYGVFEGNDDEG